MNPHKIIQKELKKIASKKGIKMVKAVKPKVLPSIYFVQ